MEIRTWVCSVRDCVETVAEEKPGYGFPGWGGIGGLMDKETGEDRAHICPEHMKVIKRFINGEIQ